MTIAPPPLEPYLAGPTRLPGLRPMTGGWTQVLADHAAQLALRDRLVAERRDAVIAMLDKGRAPAGELLSLLSAEGDRGGAFPRVERPEALRRADGALVPVDRGDPMATVARLVAEDFCLLTRRDGEAEYRLVAAALCFPSRWSLAEKLGRPMTAIHDPVPDYDADLARRVARVFDALAPARPVERASDLPQVIPAHVDDILPPDASALTPPNVHSRKAKGWRLPKRGGGIADHKRRMVHQGPEHCAFQGSGDHGVRANFAKALNGSDQRIEPWVDVRINQHRSFRCSFERCE
ncbi:MAG: heme-dependent oxidative N-demethylase subunit alpha family protein, partial [Pseudomonadota bacterium]